jgi:site-specific DNA recombinase
MKQAIGYIRVSTQDQATEGVSLEAQRAKIAAWCAVNDYELVAVFEDAGISGASMNGREGLHAALKATTKGMALVTYSISRLARSTKDLLGIAETLRSRKAALVSVTEQIDTASAMGEFFFTVMGAIATLERKVTGERTKMALAHKKKIGEVYAPTPFGYEAVEGRLREVKAEARIVAEILRRRETGDTLAEIADDLNARGVPGKRGGRWYPSTVRYLVNRQAA